MTSYYGRLSNMYYRRDLWIHFLALYKDKYLPAGAQNHLSQSLRQLHR